MSYKSSYTGAQVDAAVSTITAAQSSSVWVPADTSGGNLSLSVTGNVCVRVGKLLHCTALVTYPSTTDAHSASIGGLPANAWVYSAGMIVVFGVTIGSLTVAATTASGFLRKSNGDVFTNAELSGKTIAITITYIG